MQLLMTLIVPIAVLLTIAACDGAKASGGSQGPPQGDKPTRPTTGPAARAANPDYPVVKLETSEGVIVVELNKAKAPKTVANFLSYVKKGHYDGTVFHRIIADFMIQGGGQTEDGRMKPTDPPIQNEASNGLSNTRGTIAMARTGQPHSATCQFFINTVDNSAKLDYSNPRTGGGYCVFGKVQDDASMKVVDAIRRTPTTGPEGSTPTRVVKITKATIVSE